MVLKICGSEWDNASRDKRELSAYIEMGEDVAVLAKGNIEDKGREDDIEGFKVYRYTTRPLGEKFPNVINRVLSLLLWANFVRKELKPDVISGHNLPGLLIGWLSNIGRKSKASLIYDSHEFELGVNVKRSRIKLFFIKNIERFLIKRCVFSIMVNDSIADEIQKIYKLNQRPIVVRSTPPNWELNYDEIEFIRVKLHSKFNSDNFTIMYHGVITQGRGIEMLISLVNYISDINIFILGNKSPGYNCDLEKLVESTGHADRIFLHEAVQIDDLYKYVGAADLGMILAPAICKNHLFSLPNKFFENIQSETPLLCPSYPAMKSIVDFYDIGITCDPTNVEEICKGINKMKNDKEFYEKCKINIKRAKIDLCWENEKMILIDAYKTYIK